MFENRKGCVVLGKPRMLMISEKKSLQDSTKAVYEKFKSQMPYEIDFVPFAGHVVGLQMPHDYNEDWKKWDLKTLPLIPDAFKYKPTRDKSRYYQEAARLLKTGNYDYICNNCDPGREGQLIFHAFMTTVSGKKPPIKRLWASDPTEEAVKHALLHMRDETEPSLQGMTDASFLRSYMDWLVGMNFTRAVSIKSNQKVNLGRVMTPTLNIVAQRELEIRNFVPKDFWQLETDFTAYKGILFDSKGTVTFTDKKKAEETMKKVGKQGEVTKVDKKQSKSFAPRLHSLFDLQGECNELFGYTMSETLAIAQSLYEKKLLSYPRTDSSYITTSLAKGFKKMLKPLLDMPNLKSEANAVMNDTALLTKMVGNKSYVDDKKVSDHYAITPTGATPNFSKLTKDEQNVYDTVAKRFLAIFLPPEVTDRTTVVTESNGLKFRTSGKIIIDKGYTRIYNKNSKDVVLPNIQENQLYDVKDVKLNQGKTKPPARYTDKTLGGIMENVARLVEDNEMKLILKEKKGLGTPATRGSIVEKLLDLKMLERKAKKFHATDYGLSIIQSLEGQDIIQPELTAMWESKLTDVEKQKLTKDAFYQEMLEYIKGQTEQLHNLKTTITGGQQSGKGGSASAPIGKCPCGNGNVVDGNKYYRCEKYKNGCNFIVPKTYFGAKVTKTEMKKILAGKETKAFEMKKDSKTWTARLVYDPKEQRVVFASSSNSSTSKTKQPTKMIGTCPACGSGVKETAKFFLCENYKNPCTFILGKDYFGAKLTLTEVKKILNGKETKELNMSKGTKEWKAKLIFDSSQRKVVFASK